eukprot:CAMPEP_0172449816 /NCGR_PEP_ID=MMETSP1065-20121228/8415_1 /TAXON_ID=265537 /ORGANISM="Amphiprora paludosa, Strain CCMP125" /LENGTH=285 /DNA_ID=CAMNT_0013201561 /DNA_START=137 /DNA_END=994 /DNA_ORIENTATION=+
MPPLEGQDEPLKKMEKLLTSFMARPDAAPFLEPVDWRGLELFDYPEIVTKMMDLGTIKRKLERQQYGTAWECQQDIKLVWSNCMSYNAEGSELWMVAKSFNRKFEDKFRRIKQEFDVGEDLVDEQEEEEDDEDDKESDEDDEEEEEEFADGGDVSGGETSNKGRSSGGGGPSLDAKAQLAANLILLHGMELGHVMSILEQECPQALESVPDLDNEGSTTKSKSNNNHHSHTAIPDRVEIVMDALDGAVFTKISQYAAEKAMGRKKGLVDDPPLEDVSGKRKRKQR